MSELTSDASAPKKPTPTVASQQPPAPKRNPNFFQQKIEKFFKLLKYFIISSIILTVMEIGFAYWLISSRWYLLMSKEQVIRLTQEVNEAEPLPENFMRVYTAIFPNHVNTSLTQQVFINYSTRFLLRHTELDEKPHCFCDMVYDIQKKKHQELEDIEWDGRLQDLEYGFGVEKYSRPDKCFYYVTRYHIAELQSRLNQKDYAHLVDKSVENMNEDELIELIMLLKSRSRYSRTRKPERFQKEFAQYKAKVRKHLQPG